MTASPETRAAPIPDAELVESLCRGDEAAFELLYERYFRRIYRFVDRRLDNPADTEETVQEVFINVFSSIHTFRGEAPFAAWIFGLTRRTIASRFKRKRHATVPFSEEDHDQLNAADHDIGNEPSPLELCEFQEFLVRIEFGLKTRLTEEQRSLFRLHHIEDWPITKIASRFHKSENSVKSSLYRARRLLLAR